MNTTASYANATIKTLPAPKANSPKKKRKRKQSHNFGFERPLLLEDPGLADDGLGFSGADLGFGVGGNSSGTGIFPGASAPSSIALSSSAFC